jgi:hypothetical protein
MNDLERLAHAIMDEIADMQSTAGQFDLHEQDGSAEQLPKILEQARGLASALNDLCSCDHLPPSRLAQGHSPPDLIEPEHAR